MPNWCSHTATISHNDPAMIAELIDSFSEEKTFEHFIPLPDYGWDYDWCVEHWGTKWDINSPQYTLDGPTMVEATFLTAWAPPIPVFERMKNLGYTVKADYWDEGGFFVGIWNDGDDRCCSDLDNAPDDMAHLVAHFNYPEDADPSNFEVEAETTNSIGVL